MDGGPSARQGSRAALQRVLRWKVALAPPQFFITADASPWGLGAVLSDASGKPLAWMASVVTPLDCEIRSIKMGDCSAQAVLEALALLVAVRIWADKWMGANTSAHIRSDSAAALGSLEKLASPAPGINVIAREMALDIAWSDFGFEVLSWGHVAGVLNGWADALSRLKAPEPKAFPEALHGVAGSPAPPRTQEWWKAVLPPRSRRSQRRPRTAQWHAAAAAGGLMQ